MAVISVCSVPYSVTCIAHDKHGPASHSETDVAKRGSSSSCSAYHDAKCCELGSRLQLRETRQLMQSEHKVGLSIRSASPEIKIREDLACI